MNKLEMLYVAIHGMTPPQKRVFRLEMHKLNKGSSYELLFNYLDAQEVYNEQDYKAFVKHRNIKNDATLIGYLFDKLMITLHRMKSAVNKDKVTLQLEDLHERATSVTELGFYDYAAKSWLRVLNLADKNDKFGYTAEAICNLRALGQVKKINDFDYKDGLKLSIYERLEKCGHQEARQLKLRVLFYDAIGLSINATPPEVWDHPKELKLLEDPPPDDYLSRYYYYGAKGLYCLHIKGIEAATVVYKEFANTQQDNISSLNFSFLTLFDAHFLYISCFYWCSKPEELIAEAHDFAGLLDKYTKIIPKIHKREYKQMADIFNLQNGIVQAQRLTYEKSYTLEDVLTLEFGVNWNSLHDLLRISLLLHLAFLCLVLKAYEAFQTYHDRAEQLLSGRADSAFFMHELSIMKLIELYENNNPAFFKNELEAFRRKIKKNNNATFAVTKMTVLLRALYKSKSPTTIITDMLPTIKAQEKPGQAAKKKLPFFIWMEKRLQERGGEV